MSVDNTSAVQYDYSAAFSRNLGWVTAAEQQKLRQSRVAIAGLGGVGGAHAMTLARLGISKFRLADFDEFSVHNFNRQVGANMATIGRSKLDVMTEMLRSVNPDVEVLGFEKGIDARNIDEFLAGVDVYVDSLDFFAMDVRRLVFSECARRGIPALTAAPLGMGCAFLYFKPGGMTFEGYFRLEGKEVLDQYARFIAGLSPSMLQRKYLVAPESVNFSERRGPSTMMACDLCAGMMGTNVLKVLLNRGEVVAAPWGLHFDAYRQRLKRTWRPLGNANPLQRILIHLIRPVLLGRVN